MVMCAAGVDNTQRCWEAVWYLASGTNIETRCDLSWHQQIKLDPGVLRQILEAVKPIRGPRPCVPDDLHGPCVCVCVCVCVFTYLTKQEVKKFSPKSAASPLPLPCSCWMWSWVQIWRWWRDTVGVVGIVVVLSCDELSGLRLCVSNPAIPLKSDLVHRSPA